MAGSVGFVVNSGAIGAHEAMLDVFEAKLQAVGWITLRKLNSGTATGNGRRYELIMKGPGLSGTEQIFIGFQCYQSVDSDYYNISFSPFTGYLDGNTFSTQPGVNIKAVCAHNQRIDYWLNCDGQGIGFMFKVGTPVYEPGGVGKMFPYAPPSQYPYPMVVHGTLSGQPATRFSDQIHTSSLYGNGAMSLRTNAGNWLNVYTTIPEALVSRMRDTNGVYHPTPIEVCDAPFDGPTVDSNIWGKLDKFVWITGFNNITENTFTNEAGKTYVIFQNVFRNSFPDYFALDITP